jgi:hypothetical protein
MKHCVADKIEVKLQVFNSEGKRVRTCLDEEEEAGTYQIEFSAKGGNASNLLGSEVGPSEGIYVYRLQAGDFSATKTMLLERA